MRKIFAGFLVLAATSVAQEFRATISGRVSDSQNAVIAGVRIIATQIGTQAKFETVSAADGLYTIPFLPPGGYRLTAESPGFKRYSRDNIAAGANERLGVDIQMEVGEITETITVSVAVVGGGNSAGQAAVFLSERAKHVHMLIRGESLVASMSQYLIRRIDESPTITLRTRTEIEAIEGNGSLERIRWRRRGAGDGETRDIRHLFSMTGASPNTAWLGGCVALDAKQFIKTGADLQADDLSAAKWPLGRHPYLFETSIPRVFAVGDVRSGSIKRVASGAGEGSVAVQLVHRVLAE